MSDDDFVVGVDLDGVCADFYGRMREVTAIWKGVDVTELPEEVSYGLPEWKVADSAEYRRIHRYAVTEHKLFETVAPIKGAIQSLRRLSTEGVRIRIITHRLFIAYFHQVAVAQTVAWLDHHAIPYSDLCFMEDKGLVNADVYIEDTPRNLDKLEQAYPERTVITFTNSTNARGTLVSAPTTGTQPRP